MGNSLVQLNYMASAIFNTLFVVLVFHFVSPGTVSMSVIGERALDTLLGCALALVCSYILPWWEARYLKPLAAAATRANREYLIAGLRYADAMQAHGAPVGDAAADKPAQFRRSLLSHDERAEIAPDYRGDPHSGGLAEDARSGATGHERHGRPAG
ncbi:hypothetical protein G6F35_016315 [Rhizopus arrhizus]|nr:hypothetical protein G6F35_016315 [Rhizopus arrhizus]